MGIETGLPKPFGRYVLLNKLAIGGMAEIYKAKTYGVDGFEKQLAIKRILTHYSADKEFISMLIDEAKLTVLLSHANIVQVFDLGKVGEDYFISMEYINGTNLRELLGRLLATQGEKFSEDTAVYIMSEVCKGLDYAHRKTDSEGNPLHIVHRDISPQNILISFEGEVKIVDFGIAKAAMNVSNTSAGILKGKISYMSPEQALGRPIDHRTDIFSAGLVLYEMLTGKKLFTGDTQFEVLNLIRTKRITAAQLPDSIAAPLRTIVAKALTFSTKDRYQSAADFQLDLTKYLYSSYLDFSPRQLSALLGKLFDPEIRKKDPPFNLSEKTRSVLMKQSKMEDIVVHGPPSRSITNLNDTGPETSVSGLFEETQEERVVTPFLWLGGGLLILLLGLFAFYLWKSPNRTDKPTPARPTVQQAPEEAVEYGSLAIISTPPGATILINDVDAGMVTPARIEKLALGEEYQIRIKKQDYQDFTTTVAITNQETINIQANLVPVPKASLDITSDPSGALIVLDDRPTGLNTPAKIEALELGKNYTVKLYLKDYYEWSQQVTPNGSEPVKVMGKFTPLPTVVAPPPPPPTPVATPSPPEVTPPAVEAPVAAPPAVEVVKPEAIPPPPPVTKSPVNKKSEIVIKEPAKEPAPKPVEPKAPEEKPAPPPQETAALPPPTPAAPKKIVGDPLGEVKITSRPARADISLDGKSLGIKTPVSLANIPRNRAHHVKLELEGYKTWEGTVDLSEDKNKALNIRLEKE